MYTSLTVITLMEALSVTRGVEHIPRAECLQDSSSYNRCDISADAHRTGAIAYTVFVYGHVGVTTYRIYNIL